MNTRINSTRTSIAGIALAACVSFVANADAQLVLRYEQDPDGVGGISVGDLYSGPVQIFIEGLDSGTLYTTPFTGGISGNLAGNPNSAIGVGIMDGLAGKIQAPSSFGSEDTWAIAYVTRIVNPANNANVWTPSSIAPGKNQQLRIMAYGGVDFWGRQDSATTQTIAGKGLTLDMYLQNGEAPIPNFAGVLPSARTGLSSFPIFTNPPNAGLTLVSRFRTVNGFLDAGAGITDTELLTTFVGSVGGQGQAQAFASVDNTVGQQILPGVNIFENNGFNGVFNANKADARFVLSTQTLPNFGVGNNWTVSVSGPVQTLVGVPEPGTAVVGMSCLLVGLLSRNRRKTVSAAV